MAADTTLSAALLDLVRVSRLIYILWGLRAVRLRPNKTKQWHLTRGERHVLMYTLAKPWHSTYPRARAQLTVHIRSRHIDPQSP